MSDKPIHSFNGIGVWFSNKMLGGVNKIIGMPIVWRIKFCINMANFMRKFFKIFCFSSSNLKAHKSLCLTVYCCPEPNVFLKFTHNSSNSKTSTFSFWGRIFSNFAPAFFTQFITDTWLTFSILSIRLNPFPSKYNCIAFFLICSGYPFRPPV